jgi:hypothetical protein
MAEERANRWAPGGVGWWATHESFLVRVRLRQAVGHVEARDAVQAQVSLRGWAHRLDLGVVPHATRIRTLELVVSAIAHCRYEPPAFAAAKAEIEQAIGLWVAEGP